MSNKQTKLEQAIAATKYELKRLEEQEQLLKDKKLLTKYAETVGKYYRIPVPKRRPYEMRRYRYILVQYIANDHMYCSALIDSTYSIQSKHYLPSFIREQVLREDDYKHLIPANLITRAQFNQHLNDAIKRIKDFYKPYKTVINKR